MPVEKGLVLKALDIKLKGKSVSKNFKNEIATKWALKIETEADIDGYIEDREDVFEAVIKEADTRVTAAIAAEKAKKTAGNTEVEEVEDDDLGAEAPDWAKKQHAYMKKLDAKFSGFEAKTNQTSLEQRFRADVRLKGVPELILKRAIPKTEEEFESTIEEVVSEYGEFATTNKIAALGNDKPNLGGNGGAGGTGGGAGDGKVDESLVKFAQGKNAEVAAKT